MVEKPILFSGKTGKPMHGKGAADGNCPPCRYGQPGDTLWVREAWAPMCREADPYAEYRADTNDVRPGKRDKNDAEAPRWKPAIFMPRWASRLTLEVVAVRVERLQEITEEDARAEGVTPFPLDPEGDIWTDGKHRTAFEHLWGEINGWTGPKSWQSNPWIWRVEFRGHEAAMLRLGGER